MKTEICFALYVLGSIGVGITYYQQINRTPCIANLHSTTHPYFAKGHQRALEDTEEKTWFKDTDDERIMSANTWNKELIAHMQGNGMTMHIVNGESILTDDNEYYVPQNCYATDLDSFNGPLLWSSN